MVGKRDASSIAKMAGMSCVPIVPLMLVVACGARGPLDAPDLVYGASADGSDEGSTAEGGTGADAAGLTDAKTSTDAGGDVANPINCAVCVGQTCSNQLIACVTSQSCLGTLQCVFSKCLTGGSVNPVCAFGCSGEAGPQGLLDVLAVFQCITMSCGADCSSVIGGLGGGLGGGMAGGKIPAPFQNPAAEARATAATRRAAREAFAGFPEMCAAVDPPVGAHSATNQ